jgi:alpha-mannosidase
MLKHPGLTERRIELFINQTLLPLLYSGSEPMILEVGGENCHTQEAAKWTKFKPVSEGFEWGPAWGTVWFKATGKVPKEWSDGVVAKLDVGGERTVWRDNVPVFGIDGQHGHFALPKGTKPGDAVEIWVEAYGANPPVSVHGTAPDLPAKPFKVSGVALEVFDSESWQLMIDCKGSVDLLRE